jgi:hypothetical protein
MGHAVRSCSRSRRHSNDSDKSAVSTEGRYTKFTGTKSASAKLGALSIKDSLTLIKTSRRRYKRVGVGTTARKDEKNYPPVILDNYGNTNDRGRAAGKRELQSAKAAEKNSRLVRAKLKSLQKTLHQALQATQNQK